jgi:hypothetical protein
MDQAFALCPEGICLGFDDFEGLGKGGEDIEGGGRVADDVAQVAACHVQLALIESTESISLVDAPDAVYVLDTHLYSS